MKDGHKDNFVLFTATTECTLGTSLWTEKGFKW